MPSRRIRSREREKKKKMVQIHVSHGKKEKEKEEEEEEENQFLYECECIKEVDEIAKDLIEIRNLQAKIQHLGLSLQHHHLLGGHPKPNAATPLMRALSEAKSYASKDQALNRRPLSPHVLRDHIQTIEREALGNQSMGFSDSSSLQMLLSDYPEMELLQKNTTQLWWAGKELSRSKRLCDYVGKNEKTKIFLRLLRPSLSPACHIGQDKDSSKGT